MPTSYTSILKLALPATGELSGTWGDVVNDNITSMVEQAIAGLATINSWTANSHTLTTANGTTSESRCAMLVLDDDGLGNPSAAATVICPSVSKIYIVKNICGQTATIKTAAGTGVAIPNNSTAFVYCDGTNVNEATNFAGSVNIDGGTIDGTVIGGTTPAAGTFTTLTSNSTTTLNGTTIPASKTLVDTDSSQTLTNKTISADSNTLSGIAASSFVLSNASGNIDGAAAQKAIPAGVVVGTTDTQTLTNKTLSTGTVLSTDQPAVISVNSASTALRITQTGSGNALVVEDSANPDATPVVIDASGNVVIGATVATAGYLLSIEGGNTFAVVGSNVASSSVGYATGRRRTGGSSASNGDSLGKFNSFGWDGTNFIEASRIEAAVDGTPGTNDMPGRLVFSTTADGSSSPTERMRIDNAGRVGIGATSTDVFLRLGGTFPTTSSSVYVVRAFGTIPSAATTEAVSFESLPNTEAATFTISDLRHFKASQGTFGSGSTVTNQYGFAAFSNLIGATNNYGFYSNIASGTGRWNFYANGTAANYFAGTTYIGAPSVASGLAPGGFNVVGSGTFNNAKLIRVTDNTSSPQILFTKARGTAAASPTASLSGDGVGLLAFQGYDGTNALTAASIEGFVDGTPGTNDMPGRLVFSTTADGASSPTERMRIRSDGNIAIGGSGSGAIPLFIQKPLTGATTSYGISIDSTIQSDVTTAAYGIESALGTAAAAFTLSTIKHFRAGQASLGSGSSVTNQYGFTVENNLTGATNNYGFYSNIPSGTGRWNFYANGSADNFFAGRIGIGGVADSFTNVYLARNITGATSAYGILQNAFIQSDVTGTARLNSTGAFTAAAAFTLSELIHYGVAQGTFGAGSAVTNQYGFNVSSSLTGATNNFGFFSNIASGTGSWNFYAGGTASNYFAGNVLIGTTTATDAFTVNGNAALVAATTESRSIEIGKNRAGNGFAFIDLVGDATYSDYGFRILRGNGGANASTSMSHRGTGTLFITAEEAAPIAFFTGGTGRLTIGDGGLIALQGTSGFSIARTAVTAPAAADGNVFSGTYTPTLTNVTNVAASTAYECQYMRVGNVVTVSGRVDIDPTATGATVLGMSLPIASNFDGSLRAGGTFSTSASAVSENGVIYADSTNDRFTFKLEFSQTAAISFYFNATYRVM